MTCADPRRIVVIGSGPAGLTSAYELCKHNLKPLVLEQGPSVGGLARTEQFKGFHFDMGGHRFYSKSSEVNRFWHEVLPDDFLETTRLSRIYYEGKFYYYPLRLLNALAGLGVLRSTLILLSYFKWQLFPYPREDTFEHWVTNRFGQRLFRTFFKAYTEKVWGIPCSQLKAEWAAQRIKDLSLKTALLSMFFKPRQTIKTLIERFHYPRLGPGMMWTKVRELVEKRGGSVQVNAEVVRLLRRGPRIEAVVHGGPADERTVSASHVISSMPLGNLILMLDPPAPPEVQQAARQLVYRDFLTVCLIVDKPHLFDDNWIYVHDPNVKVGRIQNYKNWSPWMVPNNHQTSLGLEYFCTRGDPLWTMPDSDLVALGKQELERIGLLRSAAVVDGKVFRVANAYPVYDSSYRDGLETVRNYLRDYSNLQTIGRNGLHRYNNQDHAMLSGILAVRNLVLGETHDLWSINADQEYLEECRQEEPVASGAESKCRPAA